MLKLELVKTRISSIAIDDKNIYTTSGDKIYLWNKDSRECIQVLDELEKGIQVTVDERFIYCTGNYHFYVIDKLNFKQIYKCRYGQDISSDLGKPLNDKDHIYFSIRNGKLVVINKDNYDNTRILEKHKGTIWGMCCDENHLYTGSVDKSIMVWDKKTFEVVNILNGHKKNVQRVCVTDKHIISGSSDLSIIIWDKNNGNLINRLRNVHKKAINGLFCWNNYLLTSSQAEGKAIVWDMFNWNKVKELDLHIDEGGGLLIDKDNIYIALKRTPSIKVDKAKNIFLM